MFCDIIHGNAGRNPETRNAQPVTQRFGEEDPMSRAWRHFKTITHHKWLVLEGCFRVGLYWQGITHDLSKYSPAEFSVGIRYWTGKRSPNAGERQEKGYSTAWMHHKGRNRHHYEYWTDLNMATGRYESCPMPRKYLVEMVMDRRAACMTYQGKDYTDASPWEYYERSRERYFMHPALQQELEHLLLMLRDRGEAETFRYIKEVVLPGKPFPWQQESED